MVLVVGLAWAKAQVLHTIEIQLKVNANHLGEEIQRLLSREKPKCCSGQNPRQVYVLI